MAERSLIAVRKENRLPVPMKDIIRRRELILDSLKTAHWSSRLFWAIDDYDYERARACLDAGANPNARDENGASALTRAAQKRLPEFCSLLVRYGADVNIRSMAGFTPLMTASMAEDVLTIKCLIGCGAKKDAMCDAGKTALAFAAQNGCVDNVRALLEAGANPNIGDRPLLWAATVSQQKASGAMVSMLVYHGADCSKESLGTSIFREFRWRWGTGAEYKAAVVNFMNAFFERKDVHSVLNDEIKKPFLKNFLDCISSPIRTYLDR
jgi:hypothetical protein